MKYFIDSVGERFEVMEIEPTDNGPMVYYRRVDDGVEFSCLIDAFRDRFTELVQ